MVRSVIYRELPNCYTERKKDRHIFENMIGGDMHENNEELEQRRLKNIQ